MRTPVNKRNIGDWTVIGIVITIIAYLVTGGTVEWWEPPMWLCQVGLYIDTEPWKRIKTHAPRGPSPYNPYGSISWQAEYLMHDRNHCKGSCGRHPMNPVPRIPARTPLSGDDSR